MTQAASSPDLRVPITPHRAAIERLGDLAGFLALSAGNKKGVSLCKSVTIFGDGPDCSIIDGKMLEMFGAFAGSSAPALPLSMCAETQAIDGEARSQPLPPAAAFSLFRQSSFDENEGENSR